MSIEVSKQELITKLSVDKGYSVDKDGKVFNKDGQEISIGKSKKGYLSFNIRVEKGSNPTRSFVHRLQAYQKFGDKIFETGIVVRHLNGISTFSEIMAKHGISSKGTISFILKKSLESTK